MSLLLILFLLIVGTTLIECDYRCITDCTYQRKGGLIPQDGFYCAVNEWKEGYKPGSEWRKIISCTQNRPLVDGSQVPYLFKYRANQFTCNGRCGFWLNMGYNWCHNDNYSANDKCILSNFVYDEENLWPNLRKHLEELLNSYQGHSKQQLFSPMYLGIEEKYNDIANGPKEFYQYNPSSTSDPVNKYITVYPPGSSWYSSRELTFAMSARIYPRHIRERDASAATSDKAAYCCGAFIPRNDDVPELLLDYKLGGSIDSKNVIPLAPSIKTYANGTRAYNVDQTFLGSVVNVVHKFLKSNNEVYVDWTVLVHYGELIQSCRPRAIFYKFVFKHSDGTPYFLRDSILNDLSHIEFIVNNDDPKYSLLN